MERNNSYGTKSRYLFTAKGHYGKKFKSVKTEFTRVFRKYGLPRQVHTDNGSPFGSTPSIQRFTKLSYWFIDPGNNAGIFGPGTSGAKRKTRENAP